jgi:hypothetical protein
LGRVYLDCLWDAQFFGETRLYKNSPTTSLNPWQFPSPPKFPTTMQPLRHRINPQTFVITLRQLAKYLKRTQDCILNWEKWHNVLWVHIKGLGGYFISYRKLEQWIAACRTLINSCQNLPALNAVWSAILQEAQRYTEDALTRLEAIWQQRYIYLSNRQQN